MKKALIFASRNPHKSRELSALFKQNPRFSKSPFLFISLADLEADLLKAFSLLQQSFFFHASLSPDYNKKLAFKTSKLKKLVLFLEKSIAKPTSIAENGESFYENAFIKASSFYSYLNSYQKQIQSFIKSFLAQSPALGKADASRKRRQQTFRQEAFLKFFQSLLSPGSYSFLLSAAHAASMASQLSKPAKLPKTSQPREKTPMKNLAKNVTKNAGGLSIVEEIPFFSLAEDSGLTVPILNGEPSVFSARYAALKASTAKKKRLLSLERDAIDAQNRAQLCLELKKKTRRSAPAYFQSVFALYAEASAHSPFFGPENLAISESAKLHGVVKPKQQGEFGFGYDTMFYPNTWPAAWNLKKKVSMAELSLEQKNAISHRGLAAENFLARLEAFFS